MKYLERITVGFTIVELITVIMLLGILSAIAIARSGRTSDFEPRQFASTAAEQYRFSHGLSSGRYGDPVSYSLGRSGGAWHFVTSSSVDGEVRREDLVANQISVSVTNGATSQTLGSGDRLQVDFSPTGDVSTASLGALILQPDLGIELNVSGDTTHSLCIYPTGYLGSGSCE